MGQRFRRLRTGPAECSATLERAFADVERELWPTIIGAVYPKRNRIVHLAEPATEKDALLAIECAERLRSDVVLPIAEKMGFTVDVTGVWCRTVQTQLIQ
jgi:hypothetical protein